PLDETALGIIRISTNNMVQAIREVTIERGSDPREFVLVAFGGAGPTQAVDIASALGIDSILIPPNPGITSALGLLCADLRADVMKTVMISGGDASSRRITDILEELSDDARDQLQSQGAEKDKMQLLWSLDMRYTGQSHELNIPVRLNEEDLIPISAELFETEHEASYGYRMKDRDIQWVTARVTARYPQAEWRSSGPTTPIHGTPVGTRKVIVDQIKTVEAEIYQRDSLGVEQRVMGPAVIEQLDTTTYIAPDWEGIQEKDGSLWLRRASK
ncbi:MAG: hydantoinase/oxoprolinase family protein, partial [Candidatus Thorarchaeota archaeon]